MALFYVCSVYEACSLVCVLYLFIYFLCSMAWRGVALRVAFMGALGWGPCGVHSVCGVYEAFGLVVFLWHSECL